MSLSTNTQNPLTKPLSLPTRNKWTHRAIAEYLRCSRATVAIYATQIAPVVRDYLAECPVMLRVVSNLALAFPSINSGSWSNL
jgi:hypothetical protein